MAFGSGAPAFGSTIVIFSAPTGLLYSGYYNIYLILCYVLFVLFSRQTVNITSTLELSSLVHVWTKLWSGVKPS